MSMSTYYNPYFSKFDFILYKTEKIQKQMDEVKRRLVEKGKTNPNFDKHVKTALLRMESIMTALIYSQPIDSLYIALDKKETSILIWHDSYYSDKETYYKVDVLNEEITHEESRIPKRERVFPHITPQTYFTPKKGENWK